MKRIIPLVLIATFALFLGACQVTVSVDPVFPAATEVSASTNSTASQSVTLASGESTVFEVLLDSSVRANEAMYFELDTIAIDMIVYASDGTALASSTSDSVFELGTRAAATAVAADTAASHQVAPQVVTAKTCRGTCVIRDANASKFYLRVTNQTTSDRSFAMFLYSEAYGDGNEPGNDTASGGVGMSTGDVEQGAIEHLGDEEFWIMNDSGDLFFDANPDRPAELEPRLQVYTAAGSPVGTPQAPGGGAIRVVAGDRVVVFESGDDAAGPAASSLYFLDLQSGS